MRVIPGYEKFRNAIREYLELSEDDDNWNEPEAKLDHCDINSLSELAEWFYFKAKE